MNDTKQSEEEAARAEFQAREAKAREKLRTFRIDAGDHVEVMLQEQHGTHELVSYKASATASAIMASMQSGLKLGGFQGPLPATMLVRANAIAKAASAGQDAMRDICAQMLNEPDNEVDITDAVMVHSMVQADMLSHYKRTLEESAETLIANGTLSAEEAHQHVAMVMGSVIASVHAGTHVAQDAIRIGNKMRAGETETLTDRSNGHVNVQMPIAKGDSAETLKAASRAVMAHHMSGRGGGPVGQA